MSTHPTKEELSMRNTPLTYAEVFADEHEPVYSPIAFSDDIDLSTHPGNEVVGPLAKLLGIDYRELHVLLIEINPQVYICNDAVVISPDALQLVCEHLTPYVMAQNAPVSRESMVGAKCPTL
jgi:hypothetical protein